MYKKNNRPDNTGTHEAEYRKNRKKLIARCDVCAICGKPIDKSLRFPHPYSASVDHIIPISRGGHPSAMSNLALVHLRCNRLKSNNLPIEVEPPREERKHLMVWN